MRTGTFHPTARALSTRKAKILLGGVEDPSLGVHRTILWGDTELIIYDPQLSQGKKKKTMKRETLSLPFLELGLRSLSPCCVSEESLSARQKWRPCFSASTASHVLRCLPAPKSLCCVNKLVSLIPRKLPLGSQYQVDLHQTFHLCV